MAAPASAADASWSAAKRLSAEDYGILPPVDAAADAHGRTIAVWTGCARNSASCDLLAATRTGGDHWSAQQVVWSTPQVGPGHYRTFADLDHPRIAMNDAGDAAVTWNSCDQDSGYYDCAIHLALRPRGQATWDVAPLVTGSYQNAHQNQLPKVAVNDEGDVTVTWEERIFGEQTSTIRARTYVDGQPGPIEDVSPNTWSDGDPYDYADEPAITTDDSGRAQVAWYRNSDGCDRVWSARQAADGSFDPPLAISPDCATHDSTHDAAGVRIARDGDGVLLSYNVYDSNGGSGGYVARRAADGSWGSASLLFPNGAITSIAAGGGDAVAVGYDLTNFDANLALLTSRRIGGVWETPAPVGSAFHNNNANTDPGTAHPVVAMDAGGNTTLAWVRSETGYQYTQLVAQRPHTGSWGAATAISRDGEKAGVTPGLAVGSDGGAAVAWWHIEDNTTDWVDSSALVAPGAQPPTAGIDISPASPTAGETVTFSSTSTDADGSIVQYAWDLDDDGAFDDGNEASVTRTFGVGQHAVELRVTDNDDLTDVATKTFTVAAGSAGAGTSGGGGSGSNAGGSGSTGGGPGPAGGGGSAPPPNAFGFAQTGTVTTTAQRSMPAVVGRETGAAKDKVLRQLVYADIKLARKIANADDLGKRPGGGKWRLGDVIAQSPKAGTKLTTATNQQAAVTLTYWAGEKADRKRCDEMRAAVKGDDLLSAQAQLKAAGCGSLDLELKPSKKANEPEVAKADKDGDVTVTVPTDPRYLDIRTFLGGGVVNGDFPGVGADDFALTAGQTNTISVKLIDRANRPLVGAKVKFDLHEVGGPDVNRVTDTSGIAAAAVAPKKKGKLHVFSEWSDSKGEKIFGYGAVTVADRSKQKSFVTTTGRTFTNNGRGDFVKSARPVVRQAGIGEFFAGLRNAFLGVGGQAAAIVNSAASESQKLITLAQKQSVYAMQWLSGAASNGRAAVASITHVLSGVYVVGPNGVVASGGANVVASGGANAVAAGGANLNLAGAKGGFAVNGARVISDNGLGLISDNGLGLISDNGLGLKSGSGNLVQLPDGSHVVASGGGNVVAAGGANVVAAGGLN